MTSSLHPYSCSKTSEIAGPAAKSVATVSVDSWYLALPPACLPRRVPAGARPSRSLPKDEHALQRTSRGQTASLSGSLSRDGDRGVYMSPCMSAAPSTIVLRAVHVYKVWESTGRFISAGSCAFPAVKLYRCKRSME
jgi:hypothetical protein